MLVYQPKANQEETIKITPYELLEKLAALIPPPKQHRHRYHGVLVPNSPHRQTVTQMANKVFANTSIIDKIDDTHFNETDEHQTKPKHRYRWAQLITRLFECLPYVCPLCQEPMRIITFIIEPTPIQKILSNLNERTAPP